MEVIWRLKKPQISLFLMSFNHHAFSPKKKIHIIVLQSASLFCFLLILVLFWLLTWGKNCRKISRTHLS